MKKIIIRQLSDPRLRRIYDIFIKRYFYIQITNVKVELLNVQMGLSVFQNTGFVMDIQVVMIIQMKIPPFVKVKYFFLW